MNIDPFEASFAIVVGHEGGFSDEPGDSGNWTGGAVGVGDLRGTKFGISAGAYPLLDISALSIVDARKIYRRDYWERVEADALPPRLALLVFDAAVNNGVSHAVSWLQQAVGAGRDGVFGPKTAAAVRMALSDRGAIALCSEFHARRIYFMGSLAAWREFGLGWARRLSALPYQSITMTGD